MLYWLQQLQMKRWEFHNSPPAPPAAPDAALPGNVPTLHLELGTQWARLLPHTQGSQGPNLYLLLGVGEALC